MFIESDRSGLISLIDRYVSGEISNFEVDNSLVALEKSEDKLVTNMVDVLCELDPDEFREHKCEITEYGKSIFSRWKILLSSDLDWDDIIYGKDSFLKRTLKHLGSHDFFKNEYWPSSSEKEWNATLEKIETKKQPKPTLVK